MPPAVADALTRRRWLALAAASAGAIVSSRSLAAKRQDQGPTLETRIERVIRQYSAQGFHRTGTAVDRRSGEWLIDEVRAIGVAAAPEWFTLERLDPLDARLLVGLRQIDGLPLFDGSFTDATGIRGRLGPIGSDAEIGLVEAAPNTAGAGPLGEARKQQRHRAIVCVTRGGRPGLCPNNADSFLKPYGPPVLQVTSDESAALNDLAQRGTEITLIASATRTTATAFNVVSTIRSKRPEQPPLVVMTPRSGWYSCASERGGGIACWLDLIRVLFARRPNRDVIFVASSGHELGHLGIDTFVTQRPQVVTNSLGWIHLGANIGAALRPAAPASPGMTIQASDDAFEGVLSGALESQKLAVGRRVPRGTVPAGEAEVVHRGGGRYVSAIGTNALFHNPADRGIAVVSIEELVRFTKAFGDVAARLLSAG
jgi:hypothetical protein